MARRIAPFAQPRWLHDLIARAPRDASALIEADGRVFSYGGVAALASDLADQLAVHGLRGGDRVMLVAENCVSFVVAVLAASRCAAWIVPVNARHTGEELRAIRAHCGARCMLFTAAASDSAARHAVAFGASSGLALGSGDLAATDCVATDPEPVAATPATRIAALLYTTGTTSAPKGVMLSHARLCWNARSATQFRSMVPGDIVLGALPGSHIFGLSSTLLGALNAGACIRLLPRFSPQAVLEALAQGVSVMPAVPQMFERILAHLDRTGGDPVAPRLRYISVGGAPLDPDLKTRIEALFGLPLMNGYGLTETSAGVAATRPGAPRADVADVSVGTALEGVALWIDAPGPDGVGELIIEGPGVMQGYYRDAPATAQALIRPGVLRSGDLARIAPDGTVFIEGRLKELIIRSGFNVYPPEIEAMLTRHLDVLQAAVVPRRIGGNEDILAFVMARDGLTEAALRDWLAPRLIAYKLPQHIFIVESFPMAPTGKVLKHMLIPHFADRLAAVDAVDAAAGRIR